MLIDDKYPWRFGNKVPTNWLLLTNAEYWDLFTKSTLNLVISNITGVSTTIGVPVPVELDVVVVVMSGYLWL